MHVDMCLDNMADGTLFLQVEDLVMVLDEQLRSKAAQIAQRLRKAGRRVDLVLESKKMKWVFKVCSPHLI